MFYWLKLRQIRMREQKKLYESNYKLFRNILEYIQNSNLRYIEQEEVLQQVIDILLQSQAEYKEAGDIIGDYKVFCESIIKEYTFDKNKVYTILHHIQRAIVKMLLIFIIALAADAIFLPKVKEAINAYIMVFAIWASFISGPFAYKVKDRRRVGVVYFIIIMGAITFISETQLGERIDHAILSNTNGILLLMVIVAAVIEIYKRISDMRRGGKKRINSISHE